VMAVGRHALETVEQGVLQRLDILIAFRCAMFTLLASSG
jgi:hypothetical protein